MDRRAFVIAVPVLFALGCASAPTDQAASAPSGPKFSDGERKLITDYSAGERRGPRREMPAQRVKPGDKLDTGLRPTRLPDALDKHLPYLSGPYTRLVLGADVILVNRDTHDILDVIPQVAY